MKTLDRASPNPTHPLVRALHTAVRGRGRYKVSGLYRSPALKTYLELNLSRYKQIHCVCANPATGNLLVLFASEYSAQAIAARIEKIVVEYQRSGTEMARSHPHREIEPWHLQETSTVLAQFNTSKESGLSREAARAILERDGPNTLTEAAPRSRLSIFIDYFKSTPVALLSGAALLSVATGGAIDAATIMGVVVINAVLGYATESQSERIIRSLQQFVQPAARVRRDGQLVEISAREIVRGDILFLEPGSSVPADARLIEASDLTLDESALTGESFPVEKTAEPLDRADLPLGDRANMAYRGTFVTGGQGLAVVAATGQDTEMGQIQTLVGETEVPKTPMEKQLERAGSQLVWLSSGVCGLVFAIGLLRGYGALQMLKTSISLAVAAVPEGLPTVATTTLALGIQNMRKHNVPIRRLDAVEALGSVQTICLDKTGTLTANQMSVVELYTHGQWIKVSDGRFIAGEELLDPNTCAELIALIRVSVLCNESQALGRENGKIAPNGSATENALLLMALNAGVDVRSLQAEYLRIETNYRTENQNFMKTVHLARDRQRLIAVKGNPSEVLALCNSKWVNGKRVPLTDKDRLAIARENERMAGRALRVLGAACTYIDAPDSANADIENRNGKKKKKKKNKKKKKDRQFSSFLPEENRANSQIQNSDDLIWLGLIGMADPIRSGVKEAIRAFHQAGIETVMITGDQSPTACAIGRELNLSRGEKLEILDSTALAELDPEAIQERCDRVNIFARVSPAHKLQIVQALQRAGKVVAMTGDGINDAPALKAAEVGIAMGHSGTDVAREVADVVIEDDNLSAAIVAVGQGRTIYNNIRKSVRFLLSTNLSEIWVMLLANAGGWGQPLNAMQLLWLNLATDIFPGLALALEPPEPDVLRQPPRPPDEPILKPEDFKQIARESAVISASSMSAYGYGLLRYGLGPQASTIAFMSLVTGQLLHSLSCRSRKRCLGNAKPLPPNPYLNAALGGSLALQFASLAVPGLRGLLKTTPVSLLDAAVIGTSAVLPLFANEAAKPKEECKE